MATLSGLGPYVPHPRGATPGALSLQFTAVLDALLDNRPRRTSLDLEELVCVDGLLFGRGANEDDFRHYLGPRTTLIDNVEWLAASFALTPMQRSSILLAIAGIADVDAGEEAA